MEPKPHRPRSFGARGASSNTRVPTSPIVTRGSAPKGTFQIPDGGLHVPKEQSFLSRFRANRLHSVPSPAPSGTAIPIVSSEEILAGSNTQKKVNPNSVPVDEITVSTAKTSLNASGKFSNGRTGEIVDKRRSNETNNFSYAVSEKNTYPRNQDRAFDSGTGERGTQSLLQPVSPSAGRLNGKTLEQVADEAEDTLIEVVSQPESLLSETRPSYPVLRFCAGSCLLDQKAVDHLGLPLGFIWSPFGGMQGVNRVSRSPKRCGTCGSFVAKGNGGEEVIEGSRVWTCGFCGRNDNDAGEAGFEANVSPQAYPEFSTDIIEYLHPQSASRPTPGRGAIVLIVDENLEYEEAEWARAAAAAVRVSASERGLRFVLLTVGAGCSVAIQSGDEAATPALEMMSVARASKLTREEKTKFFLDAHRAKSSQTGEANTQTSTHYHSVIDVLISPRQGPEMVSNGSVEAAGKESPSSETSKRTRLALETEPRRLDIALFVAFELISSMADSENSRILSLITGPPTLAQHALRRNHVGQNGNVKAGAQTEKEINAALTNLYEQAGSRAGDMRIALDFLCFGAPNGFGGPILLGAAKRSRGGLVYTAAHSFSAASSLAEAATFLAERSTSPGVVSIRVSSPLMVGRVIGPAFPTAAPHTYAVPGIDPLTGFTIILKSKADGETENIPSHAVVQLAAKSLGVTRVVTARIPVTSDMSKYLGTLDAEISALVVGKACLVSGGALTQPSIAAQSIDVCVQHLLRGSEALAGMARLLYELRRGLLLERHVNPDCALVLRSFFLWTECGTASLLMSPRLFTNAMSDESTGLMAEVPLEKKYVTKDAVVVLDTGFNVFVYVGEEASPEAEEAISESARSVAAQRLSPCQLWKMRPGRDADYVLDSYLSPSENAKLAGAEPFEQGFLAYCSDLAPDASSVLALKGS